MSRQWRMLLPLAGAFVAAAALSSVGVESIPNFYRVEDGVAVGGQPAPDQVPALAAAGYRTVVNLRLASEFDAAPVSLAIEQAGMADVRIPMSAKDPTDAAADEFLRVTDDPGIFPVYIHCASGDRAAALWMIRRVLREGWQIGLAATEAERAGLKNETLRDFAFSYIQRHAVAQAAIR